MNQLDRVANVRPKVLFIKWEIIDHISTAIEIGCTYHIGVLDTFEVGILHHS